MKRLRLLPILFIGLILVMGAGLLVLPRQAVSYTHLTLPTIYSV